MRRSSHALFLAAVGAASAACGAKPADAVDPPLPAAALAAVDDAAASTVAIGQALAVGDAIFDFGAGIDGKEDASAITNAVRARALEAIAMCNGAKATWPTARAKVVTPVLFFDFGAGCTLPSGLTVAGEADLSIAKTGPSSVDLPMDLAKFRVAGRQLDGAVWYCTKGGPTFTVPAVLELGDATDNFQITVTAAGDRFTIDGTLSSLRGGATTAASYQGMMWRPGDCYPSAGTMTVITRDAPLAVHFAAASGARGEVEVTLGAHSEAHTLPPYGTCPNKNH